MDGGNGSETAPLVVGEGTLTASAGNSGSIVTGSGTDRVTITGTDRRHRRSVERHRIEFAELCRPARRPVELDAADALDRRQRPTRDPGPIGGYTSSAAQTIAVTAVNDAPTALSTTPTYQAVEQTVLDLRGDRAVGRRSMSTAGPGVETVTLAVGEGTLTAASGSGASAGIAVSNSGTGSVTLNGTIAALDALLQGTDSTGTLSYVDPSDTPTASTGLTLAIDDDGNFGVGGAMSARASSTIAIEAVNDTPVATAGTAVYQAIEQTGINLKNTGLVVQRCRRRDRDRDRDARRSAKAPSWPTPATAAPAWRAAAAAP